MSEQPEKFAGTSANIADEQRAKLKSLFPEIITEGGKIDFDRLKLTLGEFVEIGKERYGMNWPGKADCFKTIQKPSMATLVPAQGESVNFDTTENLIIDGDNLETLKLLQKAYLGKVKMIYIDPPYNTGNDFIYPDDYSESLETYLKYTGQADVEGRKFSTNTEADGRFHSKWLNMMYPRLFLARNLLREDGVIFISIDDSEVDNLRKICNEVFGEENLIAQVVVLTNPKGRVMDRHFSRTHDYLLVYSRDYLNIELSLPKTDEEVEEDYPESDELGKFRALELRNTHRQFGKFNRPNLWYPLFINPNSGAVSTSKADGSIEVWPKWDDGFEGCWTWGTEKAEAERGLLVGRSISGKWKVFRKAYSHSKDGEVARRKLKTILTEKTFYTERGQAAFDELIPGRLFQSPKPVALLETLIRLSTEPNDLVLDFFAGSGTTAQAVLQVNQTDKTHRKFVLIQLPEPIQDSGFKNIADVTKERVRRVIKKLNAGDQNQLNLGKSEKDDRGFKVFRLQSSNFKAWSADQPKDDAELVKQLTLHVEHLIEGRTQDDVLYELLLKSGFPLDTKVEKITLADKAVFSVADGAMLICLAKSLTPEVIKAMADQKPERVICLDAGFADNDQLKTNAVQTMKSKGVTKFQTV
jgi:adenine-specific DNA-methyltransferase